MNTERSKTNKPHKFAVNLSKRLDLSSSNKHVTLQNLSVCYTWKNIRKENKSNKPKIIVPTWNNEFAKWFLFCFRYSRLYRVYH